MAKAGEEDRAVVVFVSYYDLLDLSPGAIAYCRICHEAEFESTRELEAPCACSGTSKFAHRDCIQRWCDEKGNTTCEICLQKYEPGYVAPLVCTKSRVIEAGATIRDSLQVPQLESPEAALGIPVEVDDDYECTAKADHAISCCRSFALTFTVFLLLRHAIDVLSGKPEDYPFTLLTVLVLRMSGIIVPMLVVFGTITAVQSRIRRRRYRVVGVEGSRLEEEDDDDWDEEDDRQLQHSLTKYPTSFEIASNGICSLAFLARP